MRGEERGCRHEARRPGGIQGFSQPLDLHSLFTEHPTSGTGLWAGKPNVKDTCLYSGRSRDERTTDKAGNQSHMEMDPRLGVWRKP